MLSIRKSYPRARRRRGIVATAAAAVCLSPAAAAAQRVVPVLDVGASSVRYADSVTIAATVLNPSLRIESNASTITASGMYSQSASGAWTTQGVVSASAFIPLAARLHAELVGSAGGSGHQDATRTGELLGVARAHVLGAAHGAWIGAGAGRTLDGSTWHELALAELGAWVTTGSSMYVATLAPTSVGDAAGTSLRYTDVSAAARWVDARSEVTASVGARAGRGLQVPGGGGSAWGNLSGAFWLTGTLAVTAGAGSYPIDYAQGYPGGRFASLGLRVAQPPSSRVARGAGERSTAVVQQAAAAPVLELAVGPAAYRGYRTLAVRAGAAASVELVADFTGWQPVQLTRRSDGRWTATLAVPAGMHEVAVRVDGGAWLAPPGLTTIRDELGGVLALLLVR